MINLEKNANAEVQQPTNGLMRKTKAELVQIILRKDATEASASKKIAVLTKEIETANSMRNQDGRQIESLQKLLDEAKTANAEKEGMIESLQKTISKLRTEIGDSQSNNQQLIAITKHYEDLANNYDELFSNNQKLKLGLIGIGIGWLLSLLIILMCI